jgi:hypothetical protein
MKYATIILALMLSACATSVPITAKFPDVPDRLQVMCPELQKLPEETKLSEVNKTVVKNYTTYYECAVKVDGWIEWYNIQKHIWNEIK